MYFIIFRRLRLRHWPDGRTGTRGRSDSSKVTNPKWYGMFKFNDESKNFEFKIFVFFVWIFFFYTKIIENSIRFFRRVQTSVKKLTSKWFVYRELHILKPRNVKICDHSIFFNYWTKICLMGKIFNWKFSTF